MKKAGVVTAVFMLPALLFVAAAVAAVIFCRENPPILLETPEQAALQAEQLMDAVCSGDFSKAETFLYGTPDLGADRPVADPVAAMFWDAYVRSLDYVMMGDVYVTDTGLARDVKLISLELDTLTSNLGTRARLLLDQAVESAWNVSELYDSDNQYREDLVMDILSRSAQQALEEDIRYTYRILTLPLCYSDGQWWVVPEAGCGAVLDNFEMFMHNVISDALDGIRSVEKVYWLHDEQLVAPKPDKSKFGQTQDPKTLQPVIAQARKLLDGQELIFQPDVQIREDSLIHYYLDETILCITWQYSVGQAVYTCSEVKIAHPSQLRRFLSDGTFNSGKRYKATQMAASVNAVTASNGDFYGYRGYGNIVYNADVKMADNLYLDTCYVDSRGDLITVDMGELYAMKDVRRFVQENEIRFSLAFGPILIEDGAVVAKKYYPLGQTEDAYSRAALCQIGPLHYMLVTVNRRGQNVVKFAQQLKDMGIPKAYALDGGQTSTIVTGNQLMNPVDYGGERQTSDIIYFATAVPDGG